MFTMPCLLFAALAADPATALDPSAGPDRIAVTASKATLELAWSDAEDRLKGAAGPSPVRANVPLQISVQVGTFAGGTFDGPVQFTLKAAGAERGESVEVRRAPGERLWLATLTPTSTGPHRLEFSFRSTRLKRSVAMIDVSDAPAPRWPWYGLVALATAIALGLGARSALASPRALEKKG